MYIIKICKLCTEFSFCLMLFFWKRIARFVTFVLLLHLDVRYYVNVDEMLIVECLHSKLMKNLVETPWLCFDVLLLANDQKICIFDISFTINFSYSSKGCWVAECRTADPTLVSYHFEQLELCSCYFFISVFRLPYISFLHVRTSKFCVKPGCSWIFT